jgi:hypothetical protein
MKILTSLLRLFSRRELVLKSKNNFNIALLSFHSLSSHLPEIQFIYISGTQLLKNPISAIYTPFSFIIIYEVYLLIYTYQSST